MAQKPTALVEHIENLRKEVTCSGAEVLPESECFIFIDDDKQGIRLNSDETRLCLATPQSVYATVAALDDPDDIALHLVDVTLSDEVLAACESAFSIVDEG